VSLYIVKVRAQAFELYGVEADSKELARKNWHDGEFLHSEVYDAEVESVELDDEANP
jgi:hypothetical protein